MTLSTFSANLFKAAKEDNGVLVYISSGNYQMNVDKDEEFFLTIIREDGVWYITDSEDEVRGEAKTLKAATIIASDFVDDFSDYLD